MTKWACDTSVAIASLDPTHHAHEVCRRALVEHRPALAGHAAFEVYSVLTRLPLPLRLSAIQAAEVVAAAFADVCWLGSAETNELYDELAGKGIVGGSVYDALVGRAAQIAGRVLLTRDRRAERTYRAFEISFEFVD